MNAFKAQKGIKLLYQLFDFFLFTSLFIAFCAVGMVYQTSLLFGFTMSLPFYGFLFFGTLCSYNFHWLFTPQQLATDASHKLKWHQRHRWLHVCLVGFSLLAAALFTFTLWDHWPWLLATAFFTFLYTAPKIPLFPFILLRKIAYGKTVFLALAWMHITTQLPLLVNNVEWQLPQYLFALHRFFLIYAICILFDARDRDKDWEEGIKSIITGMENSQIRIVYNGILCSLFITALWLCLYLSVSIVIALLIPGLLLLFMQQWLMSQTSDYVFYFGLDGLMVFSLLLMLLFPF